MPGLRVPVCLFFAALMAIGCGKSAVTEISEPSLVGAATGASTSPATDSPASNETPESASTQIEDIYVPPPTVDETRTPSLTVDAVLANPELIDRKYAFRVVEVTGVVIKMGSDQAAGGVETVWLGSTGQSDAGFACHFRNAQDAKKLSTGGRTTVRGQLPRNMAQSLEDCEVAAAP